MANRELPVTAIAHSGELLWAESIAKPKAVTELLSGELHAIQLVGHNSEPCTHDLGTFKSPSHSMGSSSDDGLQQSYLPFTNCLAVCQTCCFCAWPKRVCAKNVCLLQVCVCKFVRLITGPVMVAPSSIIIQTPLRTWPWWSLCSVIPILSKWLLPMTWSLTSRVAVGVLVNHLLDLGQGGKCWSCAIPFTSKCIINTEWDPSEQMKTFTKKQSYQLVADNDDHSDNQLF